MAYETLIVEKEEGIAIVKLNRPPVNSLSVQTYQDLYDAYCAIENDESVNALILTGSGDKAFAAGLDVKDVAGKTIPDCYTFLRSQECQ